MAEKTINTRVKLLYKTHAEWELIKDKFVPLKGEACFDLLDSGEVKLKVGDGENSFAQLEYFGSELEYSGAQVFQVEPEVEQSDIDAITAAVGSTPLVRGDIAIVKKVIHADKSEYTAYVYSGTEWVAMDGNYNAENVYFDEDLVTTSAIGNITLSNGQATISAQGKNLKELFQTIFVKEKNPAITQPTVSVTLAGSGAKEVGTKVTPSYTATFNAGKYEFGPATGSAITSWSVTDSNDAEVQSTATGSFAEFTVADDTNYKVIATGNYSEGAIPKTNVGNNYTAGKIAAGSKSANSSTITGYRNSFYGTLTNKDVLTSDIVRGLNKSNKALANSNSFAITIPVGTVRVVFAYPATLRDVSSVTDENGLGAQVSSAFTKSTLSVEGLNGFTGIEYKVYTTDFAEPVAKANKYNVTI